MTVGSGATLAFNVSNSGQTVGYEVVSNSTSGSLVNVGPGFISGSGSLLKIGPGTLTLNSSANTYSGGTTITRGHTHGRQQPGGAAARSCSTGGALGVNINNLPNNITSAAGRSKPWVTQG